MELKLHPTPNPQIHLQLLRQLQMMLQMKVELAVDQELPPLLGQHQVE